MVRSYLVVGQYQWMTYNLIVNILGRPGQNVSCDLHMEHLNKEVKKCTAGPGSNTTDEAIKRVRKSTGQRVEIGKQFDLCNGSRRSKRFCEQHMKRLVKSLQENSSRFANIPGKHIETLQSLKPIPCKH